MLNFSAFKPPIGRPNGSVLTLLVLASLMMAPYLWAEEMVVEQADHPITLEAAGTIVSTDTSHIGSPPSTNWSQTISYLVNEGQKVKKGDLLVRFSSNWQEERLKEYKDQLELQRGELQALVQEHAKEVEQEILDLAEAESNLEKARRKTSLPADVLPDAEYQKLVEQKRLAEIVVVLMKERKSAAKLARESELKQRQITIKRLESKVSGAQDYLGRLTVRATRNGVAMIGTDYNDNKLDLNSRVHPGLVIVYLIDEDSLAVKANIPEYLASRLEEGQSATVIADSVGGTALEGEVYNIGNTVRRESRYSQAIVREFWVRFKSKPPESLKFGMSVKINVKVGEEQNAIVVPPEALVYQIDQPGAVVNGSWKALILGDRSNGKYIVSQGLTPGDRVAW